MGITGTDMMSVSEVLDPKEMMIQGYGVRFISGMRKEVQVEDE